MIRVNYGSQINLDGLSIGSITEFRRDILDEIAGGGRLVSMFGQPVGDAVRLFAVLASEATGQLTLTTAQVQESYDSITPECPQAHLFEREIWEQTGLTPLGHPWLKPVRFAQRTIREEEFFRVEGDEVHEVAVGPVHAGIIEPGHFRFQCLGEEVLNLEIIHGFQHRGVEACLRGGLNRRTIHTIETMTGDTTIGNALAYCLAIETLTNTTVDPQAEMLRGIALELERIANHTGDLGGIANDIGYLPTASGCGRLRGSILNLTAMVCGSRFGRGLIRPGGMGCPFDSSVAAEMRQQLDRALTDLEMAISLLWKTPSVLARFEGTGTVTPEWCRKYGFVGPVARACGMQRDVRYHFPSGVYRLAHIPVSTWATGDVLGRAHVRWIEIQRSAAFIRSHLSQIQHVEVSHVVPTDLAQNAMAITLVEGWRGEICHTVITDERGQVSLYKVVDPSFHNWTAMELAMRRQQIADFPLCNKSMSLSYCGYDQ